MISARSIQKIVLSTLLLFSSSNYALTEGILNQWQDKEYIQSAFNEIALKNEYRTTQKRILKWQEPIRYTFVYHSNMKTNPLVERLFDAHLNHLQNITGHSIQPYKAHHQEKANLSIHLTPDANYSSVIKSVTESQVKQIAQKSHCMASFNKNKNNAIIEAQVILPVDHVFSRGLLITCIVEETTQILGLPNDSDWVNPSIANDASKIELLTGLDYLLLKILYDKSLKAGAPFPQNQKTIQHVINKLETNGEIKHASKTIKQTGLFPLIN
ncbi:MAG: DUF2927 domain-containing protein [Thiomicrorhabdus sp.]|nr:DUF2927 domain-containing protein [Thiomicrorhabdus sp.]